MKSEIVAKYMRMAYDDIKKTLECQSYANKWGYIPEKTPEGLKAGSLSNYIRDYFDRKSE